MVCPMITKVPPRGRRSIPKTIPSRIKAYGDPGRAKQTAKGLGLSVMITMAHMACQAHSSLQASVTLCTEGLAVAIQHWQSGRPYSSGKILPSRKGCVTCLLAKAWQAAMKCASSVSVSNAAPVLATLILINPQIAMQLVSSATCLHGKGFQYPGEVESHAHKALVVLHATLKRQ